LAKNKKGMWKITNYIFRPGLPESRDAKLPALIRFNILRVSVSYNNQFDRKRGIIENIAF
jgi:hypothetical protein